MQTGNSYRQPMYCPWVQNLPSYCREKEEVDENEKYFRCLACRKKGQIGVELHDYKYYDLEHTKSAKCGARWIEEPADLKDIVDTFNTNAALFPDPSHDDLHIWFRTRLDLCPGDDDVEGHHR